MELNLDEKDFVDCLVICLEILNIILDYDFQYRGYMFFKKLKNVIQI